jgi:hypothetical protein
MAAGATEGGKEVSSRGVRTWLYLPTSPLSFTNPAIARRFMSFYFLSAYSHHVGRDVD